jgi:hypothetical protein
MSATLIDQTSNTVSPVNVTVSGSSSPFNWSTDPMSLTSKHHYMLNVVATVGSTTGGAAIGFNAT